MTSINSSSDTAVSNIQIARTEPENTITVTRVESRPCVTPPTQDDARSPSTPPPEVTTENKSGVEDGSLVLGKLFMSKMGNLARKCRSRGALSELYLTTFSAWATAEIISESSLQRHFKQVLFAIAHGLKLVRVQDQGKSLFWNRYRDNEGNQIEEERAKFTARQQEGGSERPAGYRDDHRGGYRDDQRGGYRDNQRSGSKDGCAN